MPLFALDEQGVKLFAAPYAVKQSPSRDIENTDQSFAAGADASEFAASSPISRTPGSGAAPPHL